MTFEQWLQSLTTEQRYEYDREGRGYPKPQSTMMQLAWDAATEPLLERIAALEAKLAQQVPDGTMLLDRKLAADCLAGMKYAAHWERDRDGRPPSQVCCFQIQDLETALSAAERLRHVTEVAQAKPEQAAQPMTQDEIDGAFMSQKLTGTPFQNGIRAAERHHGIEAPQPKD